MKKFLLPLFVFCGFSSAFGQNMNDHKVTFKYIQLPYIEVDNQFDKYELKLEHGYKAANEDSVSLNQIRYDAEMSVFNTLFAQYQMQRDSLDKLHLKSLSAWEKSVNAGKTNPDGTPLAKPAPPIYPEPPLYPTMETPLLHSDYDASNINQFVSVEGFEEGFGGIVITMTMMPIEYMPIKQTVKGSGASKVYQYKAPYKLPIGLKVESPTQGVLIDQVLFQNTKYYNMKDQKSQYDHQLYMMDNEAQLHAAIEASARNSALNDVRQYLNNQIGYPVKSRTAEIYSVKKYKDWDYSDVTNAYTKTTLALQAVKNDRDRSGAEDLIEEALAAYDEILFESNLSDRKSRINDKVTAMLQCNIAELLIWKADFDKADGIVNIAENSGEGKAKRHIRDEKGFYADQRKRWEANF